jgi:tetratricopeptide (TPR) repeat protein
VIPKVIKKAIRNKALRRATTLLGVPLVAAAAVLSWPRTPEAARRRHIDRAESFLQESRTDEAILEYRRALQIDSRVDNAYEKLGKAYLRIGEMGRASDAFRRAADRARDDIGLELVAGHYALLAGQFEEAQQRAERVLEQDPGNADALTLLANARAGLKQFDDAVDALQRAIETTPLNAAAFTNLGVLQLAAGQAAEAKESFRHSAALRSAQGGSAGGGGALSFMTAARDGGDTPDAGTGDGSGGSDVPPPPPSGYVIDDQLDLGGGAPQDGQPPPNHTNGPALVLTAEVTPGDDPVVEFHAYDEKSDREVDGFTGSVGSVGSQASDLAPVPEPGTLMLLGGGLLFVGRSMRQRRASTPSSSTR